MPQDPISRRRTARAGQINGLGRGASGKPAHRVGLLGAGMDHAGADLESGDGSPPIEACARAIPARQRCRCPCCAAPTGYGDVAAQREGLALVPGFHLAIAISKDAVEAPAHVGMLLECCSKARWTCRMARARDCPADRAAAGAGLLDAQPVFRAPYAGAGGASPCRAARNAVQPAGPRRGRCCGSAAARAPAALGHRSPARVPGGRRTPQIRE